MRNSYTLASLREGEWGRVTDILADDSMRRRLMDIGLVAGTQVVCLQRAPAGDPVAYGVRGAVIALRQTDASDVLLEAPPSMRGAGSWD